MNLKSRAFSEAFRLESVYPVHTAVCRNVLFVAGDTEVASYDATTGREIVPKLVNGSETIEAIAATADRLFVTGAKARKVSAYDAKTGALIKSDFIFEYREAPVQPMPR